MKTARQEVNGRVLYFDTRGNYLAVQYPIWEELASSPEEEQFLATRKRISGEKKKAWEPTHSIEAAVARLARQSLRNCKGCLKCGRRREFLIKDVKPRWWIAR